MREWTRISGTERLESLGHRKKVTPGDAIRLRTAAVSVDQRQNWKSPNIKLITTASALGLPTTVSIPHWLSAARDDIMWQAVLGTHWKPSRTRQGPKASGNELERLEMYRRLDAATIQARTENLKGEPFRRRVEELAERPRTDKRIHIRWQNEIKRMKEKGLL